MTRGTAFDRDRLTGLAAAHGDSYRTADPFPHAVMDGFLPTDVLDAVLSEFPGPGDIEWWKFADARERKLATIDERSMGPVTRLLLWELNSAPVLDFLRDLTGIEGLVPDPHYFGGGLHQIEPGGYLKVHADFNRHPVTGLERRLNLLVYLNKQWQPGYGGALELWDRDMGACRRAIEPVFNRCVVFSTDEHSYHGHPEPLTCPPGMTRKSLALYYYSVARSAGPVEARNTVFRARPGEEPLADRPGPARKGRRIRAAAKRWLPPAVTERLQAAGARESRR